MKHLSTLALLLLISNFHFPISLTAQNEGDAFFSSPAVHEIRFQFSQLNFWDSLKANYATDAYMRCDVSVDGQLYASSGVKYKGNSSYNNGSKKKPFRVDFAEFVDDQTHDGLKQLVLNNAFKDPTFLREKLMLDFLNAHGIAAPRATFARLYVNDHYWGLYSVVEDIGKTFLKQHFGNKGGNLFKGDPKGTLVWKGTDPALYAMDYELKTNKTDNDWSDLIALTDALNNSTPAELPDSLARYLNLGSWYDYWAAQNLFANLDSYIGSGHNYYLYHNTDTDKFEFIHWDVNEAFGNFQMGMTLANIKVLPYNFIPQPMNQRPIMQRTLGDAGFKQAYADHYCALLADFNNAALDPRIDSLADLIRADVYADTLKFFSNQRFEENLTSDVAANGQPGLSNIAGLKSFITSRRAALLIQLNAVGCTLSAAPEIGEAGALKVAPNPAGDWVRVEAGAGNSIQSLQLWSADGRLLTSQRGIDQPIVELSLTVFPPGTYTLLVNTGTTVHLRRLIKG